MKKKLCIVTGCRSDYGLLKPLLDKIKSGRHFQLQLAVTGAHLSSACGFTYKLIEKDRFRINAKIDLFLRNDDAKSIARSVGFGVIGFSRALMKLKPDLVVLLGDRFEIFSSASAAFLLRFPIAHIHGGELTEGSIDDGLRHAITKFSSLHFCSTGVYRRRVIQLGEDPSNVFNVGAPGIDNIRNLKLLDKFQLENELGFNFGKQTILVTFYPSVKETESAKTQFTELLSALDNFKDTKVIFTKPAEDINVSVISRLIDKYVATHPDKAASFINLGQLKYLSAVRQVDAVVGNSSSGLIEVPSLKRPTVNIGDRQKGRLAAESVINCLPLRGSITRAIMTAFSLQFKSLCAKVNNPYGDGHAAEKIYKILKERIEQPLDINKKFYDLRAK